MKEYKLLIPLPWKGHYYDIVRDEEGYGWQQLVLGFGFHHQCLYFRAGLRWFFYKVGDCHGHAAGALRQSGTETQ